jgi:hypothetical protein
MREVTSKTAKGGRMTEEEWYKEYKHLEALIDEQKALLTRAADALERAPVLPPKMIEALIAELRKAAK